METGRRRRSAAFGWVLFALIILAPRIAPPLAGWLSQATGVAIAPGAIVAGLIGVYAIGAVVRTAIGAINRSQTQSDTRLPTPTQAPRPGALPRPSSLPKTTRHPPSSGPTMPMSDRPSTLPGPPRFEPIIDPRVLTFGVIGLVILGALLLLAFVFAGSLP